MVDDGENQHNPAEEEEPEVRKNASSSSELENVGAVDAAEGDYGAEASAEDSPGEVDSAQLPAPEQSSYESTSLSVAELNRISTMPPEVAEAFAKSEARKAAEAEARKAEAEARVRELAMQAQQAEWEAARAADKQAAQVQLDMVDLVRLGGHLKAVG